MSGRTASDGESFLRGPYPIDAVAVDAQAEFHPRPGGEQGPGDLTHGGDRLAGEDQMRAAAEYILTLAKKEAS